MLGTVEKAVKRVQNISRSVKRDDAYWAFSAKDPSGHLVPVFLDGDKSGTLISWRVQPKDLQLSSRNLFQSRSPLTTDFGRESSNCYPMHP